MAHFSGFAIFFIHIWILWCNVFTKFLKGYVHLFISEKVALIVEQVVEAVLFEDSARSVPPVNGLQLDDTDNKRSYL